MKIKKLGLILTLSLAVGGSFLTTTASAHGHHSSGSKTYKVCTIADCNKTSTHKHNGKTYAAHTAGDGHAHHETCTLVNCTKTGVHSHKGTTYFGHH